MLAALYIAGVIVCFVFYSESSFRYNDHWVGLMRGDNRTCSCEVGGMTQAMCDMCRDSWVWSDHVPMTESHWRSSPVQEPGPNDCARLNLYGWAEMRCEYVFNFICEKYVG